jgi:hypothetical protein
VPQPLATVGALPHEFIAQYTIRDVGQHRPAPLVVGLSHGAVLGCDSQHRGRAGLSGAAETAPPGEPRLDGRERNQFDINAGDSQEGMIMIRMMNAVKPANSAT